MLDHTRRTSVAHFGFKCVAKRRKKRERKKRIIIKTLNIRGLIPRLKWRKCCRTCAKARSVNFGRGSLTLCTLFVAGMPRWWEIQTENFALYARKNCCFTLLHFLLGQPLRRFFLKSSIKYFSSFNNANDFLRTNIFRIFRLKNVSQGISSYHFCFMKTITVHS